MTYNVKKNLMDVLKKNKKKVGKISIKRVPGVKMPAGIEMSKIKKDGKGGYGSKMKKY